MPWDSGWCGVRGFRALFRTPAPCRLQQRLPLRALDQKDDEGKLSPGALDDQMRRVGAGYGAPASVVSILGLSRPGEAFWIFRLCPLGVEQGDTSTLMAQSRWVHRELALPSGTASPGGSAAGMQSTK